MKKAAGFLLGLYAIAAAPEQAVAQEMRLTVGQRVFVFDQTPQRDDTFGKLKTIDPKSLPSLNKWSGEIATCRRDFRIDRLSIELSNFLRQRKLNIAHAESSGDYFYIITDPNPYSGNTFRYYEFRLRKYPDASNIVYRAEASQVRAVAVLQPDGSRRFSAGGAQRFNDGVTGRLQSLIDRMLTECLA